MKKDIPLIAFLTAIGFILYVYLNTKESARRYDLTPMLKQVAQEIEDRAVDKALRAFEEPEHFE